MSNSVISEVKKVIINCVGGELTIDTLTDDFRLVGDILDSMAVTNLILSLEEYFGFTFQDEELSAEAFETVHTLSNLVEGKIKS